MYVKLDHVGVVVRDMDKALKLFEDILHLKPSNWGVVEPKGKGLKLALLPMGDNSIELLQPAGPEDRVARHLQEKGEGLFHLSIFAEDYDTEIQTLKEKGYKVEECVEEMFEGAPMKFAFLSPEETAGVLIEIVDVTTVPGP